MAGASTVNDPLAKRGSDEHSHPAFRRRPPGRISPWFAIAIALLLYALTALFVVSQESYVPSLVKLRQLVEP
jgi:4-hydroxybenzoate polyprenyltransferase